MIWIDAQGRDLMPALEPLFARPPGDCAIVVKAGQLKRGAPLRSAFEKAPNAASVECYPDEAKALHQLIDAEAAAAGLAIAPDARAALVDLLGADRQTTRGEIAKLVLYARGRPRIEIEDVEAIVSDAAPSALDELVDQALSGDLKRAAASATRYLSEGGDADLLMIRLIQRLTLIHRLRLEMDQGRSFDAACQAVYVRLPPAAVRKLAVQAERWTSDSLARRLPVIRAASARVRAEPRLAEILATRAIWSLASRSGGGRAVPRMLRHLSRRLAETAAEVVELLEIAEGDPNVPVLAGMTDRDLRPEREAELLLERERIRIDGARRLRSRARHGAGVLSQPLDVANREALGDDAVRDRIGLSDREQGARVAGRDLARGQEPLGMLRADWSGAGCWRRGCGSFRRRARYRRGNIRGLRRAGRSPRPLRAR